MALIDIGDGWERELDSAEKLHQNALSLIGERGKYNRWNFFSKLWEKFKLLKNNDDNKYIWCTPGQNKIESRRSQDRKRLKPNLMQIFLTAKRTILINILEKNNVKIVV